MSHDLEQVQTTILIILMAADPKPLSMEQVLEQTIGGITLAEVCDGMNKLFDRGLVRPLGVHPPNPGYRPSAVLTSCGHLHLRKIVADALASMLAEDEDEGDVKRSPEKVARMKTALIVLAGVLLRDAWCWAAAKVWCWRKRRQSQREARENRELCALGKQFAEKEARISGAMVAAAKVPYPQLLGGKLIIKAHCDHDFLRITRAIHANFRAQGKPAYDANFEEN